MPIGIEDAVAPEPERLVNLEIEAHRRHNTNPFASTVPGHSIDRGRRVYGLEDVRVLGRAQHSILK
jgi:hypothetical protein